MVKKMTFNVQGGRAWATWACREWHQKVLEGVALQVPVFWVKFQFAAN